VPEIPLSISTCDASWIADNRLRSGEYRLSDALTQSLTPVTEVSAAGHEHVDTLDACYRERVK
jgi:hypothetical protein